MDINDYVERATEDRTGRIDRFGQIIGWFADTGGNGVRAGWRVNWHGAVTTEAEHDLKIVTREQVEESRK